MGRTKSMVEQTQMSEEEITIFMDLDETKMEYDEDFLFDEDDVFSSDPYGWDD